VIKFTLSRQPAFKPPQWEKILAYLGTVMTDIIVKRTKRGDAVGGDALPDYSRGYALYRQQVGRSPLDDKLFLTGQMMRSLSILFSDAKSVTVGFAGARGQKAPKVPTKALLTKAGRKARRQAGKSRTEKAGEDVATSNAQVAYDLTQRGWIFFDLTPEEWGEAQRITLERAKINGWLF
jgi:hypothetical protein